MASIVEMALASLGLVVPATGYLVRRVIDTDKTLAVHAQKFEDIHKQTAAWTKVDDERHLDLKERLRRIEDKLDQAKIALEKGGVRA